MEPRPIAVHSQSASEPTRPTWLVGDALHGWSVGRGPLYRQLADAIGTALATGAIGDRLPSDRELAVELAVSRTTAVRAYDLLVEQSVLVRRPGSGTFVANRPGPSATCEDPLECVRAFFAAGSRGRR